MARRDEQVLRQAAAGVEIALRNVIRAWEALPRGDHSPDRIERWLARDMTPAIHAARDVLGLPNVPPEDRT